MGGCGSRRCQMMGMQEDGNQGRVLVRSADSVAAGGAGLWTDSTHLDATQKQLQQRDRARGSTTKKGGVEGLEGWFAERCCASKR